MTDPGGGGGHPRTGKTCNTPRQPAIYKPCRAIPHCIQQGRQMFKAIRKTTNKVEWMWFWLTRYMVVARGRVHWARTEAEALEWMACYPADALMMYGKRGKLIGARHM